MSSHLLSQTTGLSKALVEMIYQVLDSLQVLGSSCFFFAATVATGLSWLVQTAATEWPVAKWNLLHPADFAIVVAVD